MRISDWSSYVCSSNLMSHEPDPTITVLVHARFTYVCMMEIIWMERGKGPRNVAHPPGAPLEIAVSLIQVIVPASGRGTAKPAKSLDRQEERSMSRMLFLMPLMALATPAAAAESPAAYLGKAGAGDQIGRAHV